MAVSANVNGVAIARLSHSSRDGDIAHFDFYWTVARGPTLVGGSVADGATSQHSGCGFDRYDGELMALGET